MKAYEKINKLLEYDKYIYNIDDISEYLVTFCSNELTEEEMINMLEKINEHNMKIYNNNMEIYAEYSKMIKDEKTPIKENVSDKENRNSILSNKNESNFEQIDLWNKIKDMKDIDNIKKSLPSKEEEKFNVCINYIILKYLEEEKILFDLLHLLDSEEEEYTEIFKEIQEKRNIYNSLIFYRDEKVIIKQKQHVTNQLMFLKNINNNYCMERDLKSIPMEQRQDLLSLIESIETGNFKNYKSLSTNPKLKGSSEVKSGKIRIQFTNVKDNIYMIESVFIKKCDKSTELTDLMVLRHNLYLKKSENIKDILDSDISLPLLKEHRDYYLEIKKELNYNALSKKLVKNDKK